MSSSVDNTSNSNERKVKSLNDIPVVFGNHSRARKSSKTSKVSLAEHETNDRVEKLNRDKRHAFFSQKIILKPEDRKESFFDARTFAERNNNGDDSANDVDVNKEEQLIASLKIDPLDASNCLTTLSREEEITKRGSRIRSRKQKLVLSIIDAFLSLVIIAPMTVGFWRGTWTLMDIYGDMFPGVVTFGLGILVHTSFAISKNTLHARAIDALRKKSLLKKILCKCTQIFYTYVFGVACNMQWRGGWIIFDRFFLRNDWAIIGATSGGLVTLMVFRSVRNLISIPSVIAVDKLSYVFRFPTRYKSVSIDAKKLHRFYTKSMKK